MPNVTPLRTEDPDRIGRYQLTGRLPGMPGAGLFYLAAADGAEVTLRVLHGSWTRDAAARDRFAAEAGSATRVPPCCVARILDAGAENGYAYLVSEHVAGKSLLETVSEDGRLSGPRLEALAIGGATGLAAVHQAGLVHGNFGPEHVIMSASGPRIIEFGITPPYGPATPSADMLAWAQTMLFVALGRPPARLADLDVLPEPIRQPVADCLAGDPALRLTARSVVLRLLGGVEPPAGALAEGARRADGAAAGARVSQRPRGAHSGAGGRAARPAAPRRPAAGQRLSQRRPERGQPAPRAAAGRRPGGLAIAAAIAVIAAAGIVIVHLTQDARSASGASRPGTALSSTSPVSSTVSATPPAIPATVPPAFAGSWAGQARQLNPADVYHVRLSVPARSPGGRIVYSSASFSCTGQLSLRSLRRGALTLRQDIVTGQGSCANGLVTLATGANGGLQFSFRGKTGPVVSGTLTRG